MTASKAIIVNCLVCKTQENDKIRKILQFNFILEVKFKVTAALLSEVSKLKKEPVHNDDDLY